MNVVEQDLTHRQRQAQVVKLQTLYMEKYERLSEEDKRIHRQVMDRLMNPLVTCDFSMSPENCYPGQWVKK